MSIKTVDVALNIYDELWERQALFEDEVAPPGFEEAVREAWDSVIDNWEINNE